MKTSTVIAFLLLSVAATSGMTTAQLAGGDTPALTEAGWCERCEGKWNDKPSGCAEMKKEKEEHCNYDEDDDDDDDDKERKKKGCSKDSDCKSNEECSDRDICVTKEKSSCVIDKKKPLVAPCGGCEGYEFKVFKNDAKCRDADDNKYEYGGFDDIKKFSKCAEACVKDGDKAYLDDLKGYEWDCEKNKCKCLYEKGTLKKTGDYDFDNTDYEGKGSIKKSKKSSGWVCAKGGIVAKKGNDVETSRRRGLRASGV